MIEFVLEIIQWFSPHSGCTLCFFWLVLALKSSNLQVCWFRGPGYYWDDQRYLGGGNSNIFYFTPYLPGEMIQFDGHIFQMGWFNHQSKNPGDPRILITKFTLRWWSWWSDFHWCCCFSGAATPGVKEPQSTWVGKKETVPTPKAIRTPRVNHR